MKPLPKIHGNKPSHIPKFESPEPLQDNSIATWRGQQTKANFN